MQNPTLLALALLLTLTLTACGGGDTDSEVPPADGTADLAASDTSGGATVSADDIDCPPLEVTIDGAPVEGLDHALAFSEPKTGPGTGGYGVEVFNHAETTCEDVLASSRDVPPGEVNVRAFVQEGSSRGSVAVGSKTSVAQGIELVEKAESAGGLVAICVEGASWTTGGFGDDAGQEIEIRGLFAAEYCGERGL